MTNPTYFTNILQLAIAAGTAATSYHPPLESVAFTVTDRSFWLTEAQTDVTRTGLAMSTDSYRLSLVSPVYGESITTMADKITPDNLVLMPLDVVNDIVKATKSKSGKSGRYVAWRYDGEYEYSWWCYERYNSTTDDGYKVDPVAQGITESTTMVEGKQYPNLRSLIGNDEPCHSVLGLPHWNPEKLETLGATMRKIKNPWKIEPVPVAYLGQAGQPKAGSQVLKPSWFYATAKADGTKGNEFDQYSWGFLLMPVRNDASRELMWGAE